jgi:hypothetical protein
VLHKSNKNKKNMNNHTLNIENTNLEDLLSAGASMPFKDNAMFKVLTGVGDNMETVAAIIKSDSHESDYVINPQLDLSDPLSVLAVMRAALSKEDINRECLVDLLDFLVLKRFVRQVEIIGDYMNSSEYFIDERAPALSDPEFIPHDIIEEQIKFNYSNKDDDSQYSLSDKPHWRQLYGKFSAIRKAKGEMQAEPDGAMSI